MKFSGAVCRFVKLQRPPPLIKIFLPTFSACSMTNTERPRWPAVSAQNKPAAPAPMTITSFLIIAWNGMGSVSDLHIVEGPSYSRLRLDEETACLRARYRTATVRERTLHSCANRYKLPQAAHAPR